MSNDRTLTLLDARRVQGYVFGTNHLKQNLGASALVERATAEDGWVKDALPASGGRVLFAGGGNVALLFDAESLAVDFARAYTQRVMKDAPGLDVAVAHVAFDWDRPGSMLAAWERMRQEAMPRRKNGWTPTRPLAGLGVTAQCVYTGQPAVGVNKDEDKDGKESLVSAEVRAKLDAESLANDRLRDMFRPGGLRFPRDFEQMGGEAGRANYIAVVHADGNGMGRRLSNYLAAGKDNDDVIRRMRAFSDSVTKRGTAALRAVLDHLKVVEEPDERGKVRKVVKGLDGEPPLPLSNDYLPLRPIVFGGDDVTFVCDGRLGLELAARFLRAFEAGALVDGSPGYACAGVAIVHTHYPFARAYGLAEELCGEAKAEARRLVAKGAPGASLVNWHYAVSGMVMDWHRIREREYSVRGGDLLTIRPVAIQPVRGLEMWRTWNAFRDMVDAFKAEAWAKRRNKVKALRLALRGGEAATRAFTDALGEPLPDIAGLPAEARTSGWAASEPKRRCVYFDAIEAADLFLRLA